MSGERSEWRIGGGRALAVDQPRVMAILNVTPDSFSDGGELATVGAVVEAARRAVEAGAAVLDIGGESTRPGAARVSVEEQIARVVPAIRAIRGVSGGRDGELVAVPISVDTTRAAVAMAALDAGADIVNDVSGATEDTGMLRLVAERGAGLVLMHRVYAPDRDRYSTAYKAADAPIAGDVVEHVARGLRALLGRAVDAGVAAESIVLDPGLGFGKTVEQSLELIRRTGELCQVGRPVLSGISRKSFVGAVSTGGSGGGSAGADASGGSGAGGGGRAASPLSPKERLPGTLALSVEHLRAGARLFRVHDVAEHVMALNAAWAVSRNQEPKSR
jgi:dihydropteroate synthase